MSGHDFTLAGALQRLLDAIEAYDDLDLETVDELSDAETFARAVLTAAALPSPEQRELLLGAQS